MTTTHFNTNEIKTIDALLTNKNLSESFARKAFERLFNAKENASSGFGIKLLVLLQKKGETASEILSLVRFIRQKAGILQTNIKDPLVDGCGTGGDHSNTFNISTIACFVASGAGAKIAKHGNKSISSKCGSSDVLKEIGVNIHAGPKVMLKALKMANFAYFHAPDYNPIFRHVQPIRKSIAQKKAKTIFNLIGPLSNPAQPKRQVTGIFKNSYVPAVAEVMKKLGYQHALIFSGHQNADELFSFVKTCVYELKHGKIKRFILDPRKLGFTNKNVNSPSPLTGGNIKRNKEIALNILKGKDWTIRRDTVILNAAAILYVAGKAKSIRDGIEKAKTAIDSGKAYEVLKQLIRITHDSE